jgi:hypothetical protein
VEEGSLAVPLEVYSPERKAEFLLSNAVDAADYSVAVEDVKRMGLDPDTILHDRPAGAKKESPGDSPESVMGTDRR